MSRQKCRRILAATAMALAVAGCGSSLKFSTNTPPLILTTATAAGLKDGRGRFREVLCAVDAVRGYYRDRTCNSLLHELTGEPAPSGRAVDLGASPVKLRIRIVPGIFGQCAEDKATPFYDAVRPQPGKGYDLGQFGFDVAALRVSGRGSSEQNASEIRAQVKAMDLKPDERLVLIGHSKGMSDLLELVGGDRAVVPRGSAIVSLTGVVAGTPIADMGEDIYGVLRHVALPGCPADDGGGVTSLTRRARLDFLATHPLPTDLHYYSLGAFTNASNISSALRPTYRALARTDARNDGNVIFTDSIIPRSKVLGYLDADHWAVAMPFEIYAPRFAALIASRNRFPRVVLLEAIARTIAEDYENASGQCCDIR